MFRLLAFRLHPVVTCQAKLVRLVLYQDIPEKRIGAMETTSTFLEKQLKETKETKDFSKRKPNPRYQASMVVCLN